MGIAHLAHAAASPFSAMKGGFCKIIFGEDLSVFGVTTGVYYSPAAFHQVLIHVITRQQLINSPISILPHVMADTFTLDFL